MKLDVAPLFVSSPALLVRGRVDMDDLVFRPGGVIRYYEDVPHVIPGREWFEPIEDEE